MKKWITIAGFSIFLLVAAIVIISGYSTAVVAREGALSLKSPAETKVGDTFQVNVDLKSDIAIAAVEAIITYDATVVEFVGNVDGKMTGSEGVLNLSDLYNVETKEKTYALEFRAIAVGDAKFAFGETYVTDYAELQPIEMHSNTDITVVSENHQLSENAYLKELLVANGTMDKAFSKDIFSYYVNVEADCDTLIFSSVPEEENAVVTVDKPYALMHGENTITITVTAPAGNSQVYTITVNRE